MQDIDNKKKYIMRTLGKNEQLIEMIYSIVYQYNCDRGITVRVELPKFMKKHQEERKERNRLRGERTERRLRRWGRVEEQRMERKMRKEFFND